MITYLERELTPAELAYVQEGFVLSSTQAGESPVEPMRLTVLAQEGETFAGCASGLLSNSCAWFYLTDIFVQAKHRGQGIGTQLLVSIEQRAHSQGASFIWTRTGGHEALAFYLARGYHTLFELQGWYQNGYSHFGLQKQLIMP